MFTHQHYVPILKWKLGEYQALHRLVEAVKDGMTPLLEIPPVGFDHEAGQARETLEQHLGDLGRRLKSKWQSRHCFIDLSLLPASERLSRGQHFVDAVFEDTREHGCAAVPVVTLAADANFRSAVAAVARTDRRGVCLRLSLADFDRPNMAGEISEILVGLGVGHPETDLLLDLGSPNFLPLAVYVRTSLAILEMLPAMNRWRTVTIAGTSYPRSVADLRRPFQVVPRYEWTAYRMLVDRLGLGGRIPAFGDYAVAHPELVEFDMRLIKPFAKLRYTISDAWHIGRGTPVRTHGFGQYRDLCAELVAQPYFSGAAYSAGDKCIADCAAGACTTGNLSTWVWISTNRHLTKVVDELATFHGLSAAA